MQSNNVGVVGAGMMGTEIALCFACAGCRVVLYDIDSARVDDALARQRAILAKSVEKGTLGAEQAQEAMANMAGARNLREFADCDLVIEAVAEELSVKHDIFRELAAVCRADALFATNTSSISITSVAGALERQRAANFVGMHFFSPAFRMKLVEVIPGEGTSDAAVARAMDAVKLIGKEPVVVKDVAGFMVNRMLNIFFIEAIRLLEEGVASKEDIDKACKLALGHPVGPIELLDITGLDLNLRVHSVLHEEYGERFRPRPMLKRKVAAGKFGKKNGEGFYAYKGGA